MDERKQALLILEAIHELGIDVPIVKVCELGEKQIELYLYGGRVVVYPVETSPPAPLLEGEGGRVEAAGGTSPAVSPEMAGFEDGRPSPGKAVRSASPKAAVSTIGDVNHPAVRDLESWPSASLEGMALTELRALAKRRRIAGAGKLTKKQLIQELRGKR